MRDMLARHGTVADEPIRRLLVYLANGGSCNFHRFVAGFFFDRVGAVMTRAPLVGGDVTFVDEVQHVPCLQANILHPLVTSDLIRHAAQRFRKFRFQSVALVSRPEILKRVVKGLLRPV